MDTLSSKYRSKIKGILEGFDRIIFKGILKPLCYTAGIQIFLYRHKILNKDYKAWLRSKSAAIIADAEEYSKQQCATEIQYLASCHIRKEAIACDRQEKSDTQKGLIGTWSCVESCNTFKAVYDKVAGFPQLRPEVSRCKHLYF